MKVILQKDVKDLGKVGDVVSVKDGFARNFLFPRKMALKSSEKNIKEWNHLKKLSEIKQKKAVSERKELAEKINGFTVTFSRQASDADKLFGSVTNLDISQELDKNGFSVDKKDIKLEAIKSLGQHKAEVDFGDDAKAEITVSVERA